MNGTLYNDGILDAGIPAFNENFCSHEIPDACNQVIDYVTNLARERGYDLTKTHEDGTPESELQELLYEVGQHIILDATEAGVYDDFHEFRRFAVVLDRILQISGSGSSLGIKTSERLSHLEEHFLERQFHKRLLREAVTV